MKAALVIGLTALSVTMSGCTYVAHDLRYPGGAVGGVLDRRMFDASKSKQLVLLRNAILIAMVARAGTVYARDRRDADAYVNYMVSASDEINILAGHIWKNPAHSGLACGIDDGVDPQPMTPASRAAIPPAPADTEVVPQDVPDEANCFTYDVNFESDVPTLERRLFRLAMAALPQEQAKRFLDQVTKGDLIGAAIAALNFSIKALDGLHSGAAVHRTGIEIVARQYEPCATEEKANVYDAAKCMKLPLDQLFVGKIDNRDDYTPEVRPAAFRALLRNIHDSCRMISLGVDEDDGDLNQRRRDRIDTCTRIKFQPRSRWAKQ